MKNREEIKFNKVVNFDKENNEVIVLDGVFKYNDGFKGATGSIFEPVTRERYDEVLEMDVDEIADYLIDAGFELPECQKGGFIGWASDFTNDDRLSLFFDLSYTELHKYIREQIGLTEDEAYMFNCIGGGRCFDNEFKGNINPELSKIIRKYES